MARPDQREIERRMARFEGACREAGLRLTHQRMEIFREVARAADHPDADTVHRRVRERMPTVSLDTVYRTLWLLEDLGLVATLGPSRGRARFDANLDRHHHFVCVRCGMTRDFHDETLDDLALPRAARAFGRIEATLVEVRGICHECSRKNAETGNRMNRRRNHGQEE